MAYRLTDASALGLDLARTPGGVEAAGVLLRLLLVHPDQALPPVRARADLVVARVRAHDLLGPAGPTVVDLTAADPAAVDLTAVDLTAVDLAAVEDHVRGRRDGVADQGAAAAPSEDVLLRRLRRMARRLGAVSFGTVADLLALGEELARDLGAVPRAGSTEDLRPAGDPARLLALPEVVGDALLAALLRGREPHGAATEVLARSLEHRLDPPPPASPALPPLLAPGRALRAAGPSPVVAGVASLLERVAAGGGALLRLQEGDARPAWAEQMHSAAWAVQTTGRTRLAGAAQLDLLRALHAAGVGGDAWLAGVWNACSGAVQAQVVADVLPGDTAEALSADLRAVLPG